MANVIYNSFKKEIQSVDWVNDATIKVSLRLDTYVPNIDTHVFFSDLGANESSGVGYTAGGLLLANKALTVDNTADLSRFSADDAVWGTSTITAYGAVIYQDTGVAGTSKLICYVDFGQNKSSDAGDLSIQWHPDGIFTLA